jgi:hypothetical protein
MRKAAISLCHDVGETHVRMHCFVVEFSHLAMKVNYWGVPAGFGGRHKCWPGGQGHRPPRDTADPLHVGELLAGVSSRRKAVALTIAECGWVTEDCGAVLAWNADRCCAHGWAPS